MIYSPRWQHLYKVERKRIAATPEGDLRLHRLERPVPWPNHVWPQKDHIERYPDYAPLIHRIAAQLGVEREQVVLGLGIEDFIRSLVLLTCEHSDTFMYSWPACAMFDVYAQVFNTRPVRLIADADRPLSAAAIWELIELEKPKLLLLPNPGQPVDTCYTVDELRSLAFKCMWNDCVFAIDEAYYGFGAPTALELINECENVVILRTFSKAFGAAGIRLGYAVGSERAVHPLDAIRLSGEVAGLSMRAAARLLAYYPDEILAGINQVIEGRDWLKASLRKLGYKARGEWANHVLLDLGSPSEMRRICAAMDARGVHVKGNYPPPLDRHLLITAGPLPLMERFLDVFDECRREQAA